MTKDELITELRGTMRELAADKSRLYAMLELTLNRVYELEALLRETDPISPGAMRQRRYRERHQASPSDVTRDVTRDAKRESGSFPEGSLGSPPDNPRSVPSVTLTPRETNKARPREAELLAEFREAYPRTSRTSPPKTELRFRALSEADQEAAVEGARHYARQSRRSLSDEDITKGAQSWLLERRWETVDDVPDSGDGALNANGNTAAKQAEIDAFNARIWGNNGQGTAA